MKKTPDPADRAVQQPGAAKAAPEAARRRSPGLRLFLIAMGSLLCAGFFALGTWQMQRLQWKLALIERVEERVHAAPVPAPAMGDWPRISAATDEYRHVRLNGVYLPGLTARVQASTVQGRGYWLLTPLCQDDGSIVLVNRGFVTEASQRGAPTVAPRATASACAEARAQGQGASVSGLLRISEPKGGFLRQNDAAADRWYSRDVAAIAAARQLSPVAPYFVDADAVAGAPSDAPVGGLTVVSFQNNHLVYALTWYALALMVAGSCYWVVRDARAPRKHSGDA
ncbi:SURF1 family protein [Massilia sp. BJB1822]|uniref:SURF1 family protein n=1 Tax=Massilia sp. BJB1822 TaxID=2744470 RepID=UPI001593A1B9|nr:SURF1 family protein [Massilia sp. BJB1822]NVE00110.1 SURF1 family protein [Massilia sp. BJB1822]